MIKRIASAFLALLILVSALPLPARAATQVGDTVLLPAMEEPGAGWAPDTDAWMQRGCDLEGHVHDQSCVSADNFLVCDPAPGTHIHDQNCGYYDIQYQWVYTGKVTKAYVSTGLKLTVQNVDPQGNPIEGATFNLYEKTGTRFMNGVTDSDGIAVFKNIKANDKLDSSTWILSQNALTGELGESYLTNTTQHEVTITKDRTGKYSLSMNGVEEYDAETQTVTVVNQPKLGMLLLEMKFEDDIVPVDSCNVTLTGPEGYSETITFSADMDGYYWQKLLRDLPLGEYTVTVDAASAQVEGYELVTTCQAELFKQSSVESNSIELTGSCTAGTITIHNRYRKAMPKTVQIRTEDTLGNLLGGAAAGIYLYEDDYDPMQTISDPDGDGIITIAVDRYLKQISSFLDEGESQTVILKQTKAPEGYEISENTYELTASKIKGDLVYDIPGARIEGDVMNLSFLHPAKTGTLTVELALDGKVPETVTEFPVVITNGKKTWNMMFSALGGEQQLELPMGQYTVMLNTDDVKATGYDLMAPSYSKQKITFNQDGDTEICTITTGYERIKDPKNRVLVKAVDTETEEVLSGAEFVLVDPTGRVIPLTKSNADGSFLVENLEDLAVDGQTVTCTLYQSKAPFGYKNSEDQYLVEIKESNGNVTVTAQRDANFFSRLFRSGVEKDAEVGQTAVFRNEAILVDLTLTMAMYINFGEIPLEKIPVTITGENFEKTIEMADKEEYTLKDMKLGQYTITQEAEVDGYTLTTEFDSGGGAEITGDQLMLTREGVLFICNEYDNSAGSLEVAVDRHSIPDGMEYIWIKVTDAAGAERDLYLYEESKWAEIIELAPGTYTVSLRYAMVSGYVLDSTSVKPYTVEVESNCREFVNFYPMFKKASDDLPTNIQFSVKDQFGRVVPGTTVSVTHATTGGLPAIVDNSELDANKTEGVISVDLTGMVHQNLVGEHGRAVIYAKQTAAPEGYTPDDLVVPIFIEKIDGNLQWSAGGDVNIVGSQVFVPLESNALETGSMRIKLNFAGDIPQSIIESYHLSFSVKEKNGYSQGAYFTSPNSVVENMKLPLGEYMVKLGTNFDLDAVGSDYDVSIAYSPEIVSLTEIGQQAEASITITFTKKYSQEIPDQVVIRTKDTNGKLLGGASVGIFLKETGTGAIEEMADEDKAGLLTINVADYLEAGLAALEEGKSKTVYLKQTQAPEGYGLSTNTYALTVTKKNGEAVYDITGAVMADGVMYLDFVHEAKPEAAPFDLIINMTVDGDYKPEMIPLTVAGEKGQETFELSAANNWSVRREKLARGTYTVTQEAAAEGYQLTDKILVDGGKITADGVLTVDDDATEVTLTIENTYKKEKLNTLVIYFKDDLGNTLVGGTIGLFFGETELREVKDNDRDGIITIDNLEELAKDVESSLPGIGGLLNSPRDLTLKQTVPPEGMEGKEPVTGEYTVTVQKVNGELQYAVAGTTPNNGTVNLLMEYPVDKGTLHLEAAFTDDVIPGTLTSLKVIATDSSKKPYELTLTKEGGWKADMLLPVGVYTVSLYAESAEAEGYSVKTSYDPKNRVVKLEKDKIGTCVITNTYTEEGAITPTDPTDSTKPTTPTTPTTPTKPKVEANGQMIIRTVDERGALWGGANYGLFYGSTELRSFTDYGTGAIHVDDPELVMGIYANQMIAMGAPLTLKQTKAPNTASAISDKAYSVFVVLKDGKVGFEIEGAEVNPQGIQIAEFINQHKQEATAPAPVSSETSNDIIIRTLDDSGNALAGAEYCLSADQYFDKEEDAIYDEADRHGEIVIDDLAGYVENGKKATWYLMQSRQPENSKLSTDRFKVELTKKNNKLEVEVKKDEGLFDTKSAGTVEEEDNGAWIVSFVSNQKTTTVNVTCNEVVDWNDCLEVEDILKNYKQSEYEFQLNWEKDGQEQEPMSLKLKNGETGSFEPLPNGARYEIILPQSTARASLKQGQLTGTATAEAVNLEAEMCYDIRPGEALAIDMVRIDAQTEEPLAGAVYVLKDKSGDEVDTYKTRKDGKLLVDAIMAPGEYTLTETETPNGYSKIKKDIAINVAVALEEGTDASGNPVLYQKLKADVYHSMVKRQDSGTYRIGSAQDQGGNGTVFLVLGGVAAAAGAAGAGTLLYRRRRSRKSPF